MKARGMHQQQLERGPFLVWMGRKYIPGMVWFPLAILMALWMRDEYVPLPASTALRWQGCSLSQAAAEMQAGKNVRGQESPALDF